MRSASGILALIGAVIGGVGARLVHAGHIDLPLESRTPLNFPTFSGHAFIRTNLSLPAIRGSIDYALNWAATKAAHIAETPISRYWALRANFRSAVEFRASLKVIRHASQPVSTLRSGPTADKLAFIGVQKTPSKGGSNVF